MLHNNLGMALWTLKGPKAALPVLREGLHSQSLAD